MKSTKVNGRKVTRDWTQGNIGRNLVALAWPVMVSQSLNMIGPFIDMVWVGRLGSSSVAGVGVAGLAVMLANAALTGLTTGMRVLIGRYWGAGDKSSATHAAHQSFVIGIMYAIFIAIIGIFLAVPIVRLFGVDESVVTEGAAYLRIQFIGIITMTLLTFNEGCMQASGDTMIPMRLSIIYRITHIILCPFLIFGWWVFPELGVRGAALSDVLTQGIGGIAGMFILFGGYSRLKLSLKNWRPDLHTLWRMFKIGLPNGFMNIQQHLSMMVLMVFIARFGTIAVASHALFQRVDSVLAILTMGVGVSAGVLGAQNLGAGKPNRAEKSGWLAAGFAGAIMLTGSIIILIWAEPIVRIFTHDPTLIEMSSKFLRIACTSYIALGVSSVFRHFMTGVGDTLPAFIMEIAFTWGLLIPLVYFSTNFTDFGIWGIRWSLALRLIMGGIIFTLYFWLGKWKSRKI